jgi:hypothetical protein
MKGCIYNIYSTLCDPSPNGAGLEVLPVWGGFRRGINDI